MNYVKYVLVISFFLISIITLSQEGTEETNKFIASVDDNYFDQPLIAIEKLEKYLVNYKTKKDPNVIDLDNLYYGLAYYSLSANDLEKTKKYSKIGIENINKGKITGKAGYYNLLGNVAQTENKLDSSANYFIRCIKELEIEKDLGKIPFVLNNIGLIYSLQGDYTKSLNYHLKAYKLIKVSENENGILNSAIASSISQVYIEFDSLDQANKFANIAIKFDKNNNPRGGLIDGYGTKSKIAERNKLKDSASYYALKSLEFAILRKDDDQIARAQANLARLMASDNPDEAIKYGNEAYKTYKKGNYKELQYIIKILSEAYINNEDFKNASILQKEYIVYQDSLLKTDYTKNTIDILEKYEASQKELKIKAQNLEITKKENQKNLSIIIATSLAIIALLILYVFTQYKKTQRQKYLNLENEKENVALKSLMAGEEKERSRIAKELHDGIGSLLAASKMHASQLKTNTPETSEKLLHLLDNASKETRRISHNLLPESLVNKGLDVALQDFIASINESQLLKADYQSVNVNPDLPQSTQLSIYRIIQELINNIIKHSGATEAFVQLNQNEKKLFITVEDNGKGFSYDKLSNGIGLQNIESRLSLLNGKIEVDSQDSLGTSVYVEFELKK